MVVGQQVRLVGPTVLGGEAATDEVRHVERQRRPRRPSASRRRPASGCPVGTGGCRAGNRRGWPSRGPVCNRRYAGRCWAKSRQTSRDFGRERAFVALEESRQQRAHQCNQETVGLGRGTVEPLAPGQVGVLPARGVQAGHLVEDRHGPLGAAGGDLVPLRRTGDVFEEEREPAGSRARPRPRTSPARGRDARGDLAVEAHLYLVGPQGEAGAATLVVGGRELADQLGGPAPSSS